MRIVTPEFNLIKIGYQGENEAVCVQIGVQNWPELYGAGGTFSLRHQRAGDPDGYPVIVTEEDGTVSWVVSNIDTRDPGYGKATLIYKVNDVIAMSVEYSTLTEASVGENPEPPEPWKPWIDEILEARDEAVEAAEDAHEDANSASQSADDASTEALKAEGYAVGTQDGEPVGPGSPYYQNSAKYYHDDIMGELGPIQAHLVDHNNPHQVTASQIGAIEKVAGAVADNLASFTSDGSIKDSNISADWLFPVKAKSGTAIEFNSDAAVPLKSALIKGKTAVLNQLVKNGNFADTSEWSGVNGTIAAASNILTYTAGSAIAYASRVQQNAVTLNGHTYYLVASFNPSKNTKVEYASDTYSIMAAVTITANEWTTKEAIATVGADGTVIRLFINRGNALAQNDTVQIKNCMLIDLTLCGFTSDETASVDALKTAWLSKFGTPLPQYIPYNAGLIVCNNAVYQLTGANIWDEEWEVGGIDSATGANASSSVRFRSKNYIPCKPNMTLYYKRGTGDYSSVFFYDANKNYLGASAAVTKTASGTFTVPNNACYLRFYVNGTTTYANDISINYPATFTTYEPYHDGGSITADSLNGIGTVADEQDEQGNITRRFGVVDLGSLPFAYNSGWNCWTVGSFANDAKLPASNSSIINAMIGYATARAASGYTSSHNPNTFAVNTSGVIFVDNGSTTNAPTGYIVYELATPTTDTTTPASLITQKGYNLLRTVSGDIQSVPAEIEHYNGLAAVVIEAVQ